jgi:hypothetical protein
VGIDLFHYLDILIGFAMVMLITSSMVTVITQWFLDGRLHRSRILEGGLSRLITEASPRLAIHAEQIARQVLLHPLVADLDRNGNPKAGSVVRREELILILLELAESASELDDPARTALREAITEEQGSSPHELLRTIQKRVMELEIRFPTAARYLWQTQAIVETLGGQFVSGLMTWFDQANDRLTQAFTAKARQVTLWTSLAVALLLPMDSIELLRRLSVDDQLKNSLIARAQQMVEKAKSAEASGDFENDLKTLQDLKGQLDQPNLSILPATWWKEKVMSQFPGESKLSFDAPKTLRSLAGVLLSVALMSLGAPFWFDMLKNLLKLRPAVAAKEEQERQDRASNIPPIVSENAPIATVARIQSAPLPPGGPEAGVFGSTTVAPAEGTQG